MDWIHPLSWIMSGFTDYNELTDRLPIVMMDHSITRRLIINADDYGLSPAVSNGILTACSEGVVTSTSVMINHMVYQAQSFPAERNIYPGFGVHLNLTSGKPILPAVDVSTIVNANGEFFKARHFFRQIQKANVLQIEKEWRTQITAFLIKFGRPDHLDSHHHVHLHPLLFPVFLQIAGELRCPIRFPILPDMVREFRELPAYSGLGHDITQKMLVEDLQIMQYSGVRTPDYFCDNFITPNIDHPEIVRSILQQLPEGITEMMCHPGLLDDTARSLSNYKTREEELQTLQAAWIRPMLEEENILLARFTQI